MIICDYLLFIFQYTVLKHCIALSILANHSLPVTCIYYKSINIPFQASYLSNCILDGLIIILRDISKKYEESY